MAGLENLDLRLTSRPRNPTTGIRGLTVLGELAEPRTAALPDPAPAGEIHKITSKSQREKKEVNRE
jgi:hypothetical protein